MREGRLPTDVAQGLNDEGIPVRSESVGNMHTRTANEIKRKWTRDSIVKMAKDETYLGYVISEKSKKLSYKSKKVIQNKKEEQIKVANRHEPLVDQETFDIVQALIESRTHTRVQKNDFLLKGLLECAECGKKLSVILQKQRSGNKILYLRCNTYASMTRLKLCTPHSNNCEKLTNKVLETIKTRLKQYQKEEEYFVLAKDIKDKILYKKNLIQTQIDTLNSKYLQLNKKIDQIYDDKLNNIISVDDFERMYKNISDKKEQLSKQIADLTLQKEDSAKEIDLKKIINQFVEGKDITREMLVSLVDRITVSEQKEIKIYYKFSILNEGYKKQENVINIQSS